ncbi:MAG TPA: hypothetical protein VG937_26410 [Polyangiaceae bacterium]|nr:hypothetical protein [Polyangiaceae bacterium]
MASLPKLIPRRALVRLALGLSLLSGSARGEEAGQVAGSLPMARYRAAHAAMQRGNWAEARTLLLALWERSKSYDVAASLAQVEHAQGNDVLAARYLTFALSHLAPKERPETLARYRAALSELEAQIGRIEVNVNQPAAEIRLDGAPVGMSPLPHPIFVDPGPHTIEAQASGVSASKQVELSKGELLTVELSLAKPAPAPPPETIATPGPAVPSDDRSPEAHRSLLPVYAAGGLAVVGAAVAVGFGLAADSDETKANALKARLGESGCADSTASRSTCDAAERAVQAQRRDALWSNIGIGVASASLAAGLGYLLFWPAPNRSQTTARLRPGGELTETGIALSLAGEF